MPPRFIATTLTRDSATVDLPGDEAHHLSKVLRLREGDSVLVFDGAGLQRHAHVCAIQGSRVTLQPGEIVPAAPELPARVVLAQALLKGDSMDHVVRDATTIGVHEIVPLVTSRIEARVPAERAATRIDRWQRVAVSATKQCGRAVLPQVRPPLPLRDALALAAEIRVMLVEPTAGGPLTTLDELPKVTAGGILILIGPEGGWAPDELQLGSRHGAALVTLGGRTLRAETVAIAALPVVLHRMAAWP